MKRKLVFSIMMVAIMLVAVSSLAAVSSLRVAVDGMSCPFCAFGVEKRLKKVNGVASVVVDMKSGIATLIAGPGGSISYQEVAAAVTEAGFTAGNMQMTASGVVVRESGEGFVLRSEVLSLPLIIDDNEIRARLDALAGGDRSVAMTGPLFITGRQNWAFSPKKIDGAR